MAQKRRVGFLVRTFRLQVLKSQLLQFNEAVQANFIDVHQDLKVIYTDSIQIARCLAQESADNVEFLVDKRWTVREFQLADPPQDYVTLFRHRICKSASDLKCGVWVIKDDIKISDSHIFTVL